MRKRARPSSGFTLVELMIVVVIVGILATLATYGVRRYVASSKTSEATGLLSSIRINQELYKQETFVYLDVSAGNFSNLHPTASPGKFKSNWSLSSDTATSKGFKTLGVESAGPVYFAYGCVAGRAAAAFPTMPTSKTTSQFGLPTKAPEAFYVAVAKGDVDGDGVPTWLLTHSLTNEVYIEGE